MTDPKAEFERLLAELRPRLHRYCARMTGSVIDGEDVLQETLIKAIEAFPHTGPLANAEGWLFRIAHNAALDFLRRRARREAVQDGEEELETIADPDSPIERRQDAAAGLGTLMRRPSPSAAVLSSWTCWATRWRRYRRCSTARSPR